MSSMATVNESKPQAAGHCEPTRTGSPPTGRQPATLDPQLLMAACRGDSRQLKDLLLLKDDGDQQGTSDGSRTALSATATTAAAGSSAVASGAQDVIVEVDHDAVALATTAPPSSRSEDGVTSKGGSSSLLHVVDRQVQVDIVESNHHDAVALLPSPSASSGSSSPPPVELLDEDGVTMEGDSLLHVVAACGDTQEYIDCAKMIVRDKKHKGGAAAVRLALEARNHKGDTPLHCAAGAGNANMISCLIDLIAYTTNGDDDEVRMAKTMFLRLQNECGETTLHQAIRAANNKVACIDLLMDVDPELACLPCDDEDGASPLYQAISLGEVEIARHLYVKSKGKLSYSGPDGRNALHAAVHRGQALPMILGWLTEDMKPKEDGRRANVVSSRVSLVSRLTSQRDRKHIGSTPLHLAASLEGWPVARFLSRRFPQVWPGWEATARLLLDANESMAYQADDRGLYPIHVAAVFGSLGVVIVKMLLERCPDCATMREGKGRTFLHVAARNESLDIVRYVCRETMPQQLWRTMILNAQDSNGDTALHYAVRAGNLAVFNCLLRNRQVRLDVANKDGMTPLDLSWTMIANGFYYGLNPRNIVCTSLVHAGAPHGGGRPDLFFEKHIPKTDVDKESKEYTEATQVMSIVTALIATVTFASAFTLPGGYRSADSGGDAAAAAGTPVLAGTYAFDAFILADTLAFICSISATCTLVYAGVPAMDIDLRNWYFNVSAFLLQSAARSLVAAFGLGLYLVVHHTASAIAACVIVFVSSLYGNMEVGRIVRMASTVGARIGIPRRALVICLQAILFQVLAHFWSYLIIFGLPAIRKRVH